MLYDIEFARIGRHETVPPLTITTAPYGWREPVDVITSHIHAYARQYLVSHSRGLDIEVDVDLTDAATGSGSIYVRDHHVGDFTIRPRARES
jgi:hypothetical protein